MLTTKIFMNIQEWLLTFGTEVLDNLMCVCDETSYDPEIRYCDFQENFNKHFSTADFWGSQVGGLFPNLSVQMLDNYNLSDCFTTIKLAFTTRFKTVGPSDCECGPCICNSPKCRLEYMESMICALRHMLGSWEKDENGEFFYRTFASDLMDLEIDGNPWEYPMQADVLKEHVSDIKTRDEMLYFTYVVELSINDINCGGYE